MVAFKTFFIALLFATLSGCDGKPPTEFDKQMLEKIEAQKLKTGVYPPSIDGNLLDIGKSKIETNDFFYIVDSTKTYFTLKIFNESGLSDVYDSRTKQWIRTDK